MNKLSPTFLLASILLVILSPQSWAQEVYATNEYGEALELIDLSTGKITVLYSTASINARLDSLLLNSQGQIIYSVTNLGLISLFDPSSGVNTVLATVKYPRDLVMDPGGTSLLIALYAQGQIARLNLLTGTMTILTKNLKTTDGMAYDPAGHLFVVAGRNQVCQIDPVSGAVLKCLVLEPKYKSNGGDGMVYDSYTGQLWVTHDGTLGNGLIEIPTDLSGFTLFQTGKIITPDGIASDGKGNLYIGAGTRIVVYNIPTDTLTKSIKASSIDDVALVPGTF
jgi:DNA-binding beta-propeller fold protein YncE